MPASATPRRTPATGRRSCARGAVRFTAIAANYRSGELAVAVLVLLAGAAGARVVAADLLAGAHEGLRGLLRGGHRLAGLGALGRGLGQRLVGVGVVVLHVPDRLRGLLGAALGLLDLGLGADLHRHHVLRDLALD